MVKKRVLTPGGRKPQVKPHGRIGKGLIDLAQAAAGVAVGAAGHPELKPIVDAANKVIDTVQDNVKPEAVVAKPKTVKVEAPETRVLKIIVTKTDKGNHSQIDVGGMNLVDAITYIKFAHQFLMKELIKAIQIDDSENGTADEASGSNT